MSEDEVELEGIAAQIASEMVAANVARRKFYLDERLSKEYSNLITPDAFDKPLVVIAVLGYPERVGVWSYTLLRQSRIAESSMEPYFREFGAHGFGLVAIDPNYGGPDIEGDSFVYQLDRVVADIAPAKRTGFIGFSMGGKILVEFLEQRPEILDRVAGLVLIDPTLPNRLSVGHIRPLLDDGTLLIASQSEDPSPGEIASVLLDIPKISYPGIHGEMPNKALGRIIDFYEQRTA
ncbi:MAG: alpha/beta hydrolase [Planctomycetota bacterium]|jgi:pimeloyl-ACP methyl ester carboxylesterase